jgi:hypothetical protein
MPTYSFKNINTGEEIEVSMKIADLDAYKEAHPELKQFISRPPSIGDSVRLGLKKPDSGFRDVLKNVKSHHPGSRTIKNKINDW